MKRQRHPLYLSILIIFLVASACTSANSASSSSTITVEGDVQLWGNEPFTAYVLETVQQTYYILDLDEEQLRFVKQRTHGRYRLTGREYPGLWQGQRFTRIDVDRIELL